MYAISVVHKRIDNMKPFMTFCSYYDSGSLKENQLLQFFFKKPIAKIFSLICYSLQSIN